MGTAAEALRRLQLIDVIRDTAIVIDAHIHELKSIQQDQLFQGVDADGRRMMSILDDPYFENRQAAWKYAQWKISMFPEARFGAPNLFITGFYHSTIVIQRTGDQISFDATATFAADVAKKYGNKELGLNSDSRNYFKKTVIRPELVKKYAQLLGCGVK